MSKNPFLYVAAWAILMVAPARADDAPVEVKTAGYHLKKRSEFTVTPGVRAPFWPIGWAPAAKGTTKITEAPAAAVMLKPEQFSVTSILLGSQSLAVINGRTYGEGEFLKGPKPVKAADGAAPGAASSTLPAGMKIQVVRITDGSVTLRTGAQALTVPLKRQQLMERKSEDELLSQVGEG